MTASGRCLCGAVTFRVAGALPPPDACHCSQCRRQSGHYWALTDVPHSALSIAVAMGAFDAPTGTRLHMHIFTADKGDYYEIEDGLPQRPN